jgi:hypothetical protein
VRGLTLRLADPELTPPAEGRAAVAAALPLLLEKGLTSQARGRSCSSASGPGWACVAACAA